MADLAGKNVYFYLIAIEKLPEKISMLIN